MIRVVTVFGTRPEAVKLAPVILELHKYPGRVRSVGPNAERIVQETERLLYDAAAYDRMALAVSPYGDGHAAERIVRIILEKLDRV